VISRPLEATISRRASCTREHERVPVRGILPDHLPTARHMLRLLLRDDGPFACAEDAATRIGESSVRRILALSKVSAGASFLSAEERSHAFSR
jgi:hypothetical protein